MHEHPQELPQEAMKPPPAHRVNVEAIPHELRARPQWVVWQHERRDPDDEEAKPTKVPYRPSLGERVKADSTNPKTWGTFEEALDAHVLGGFDGIGYVLDRNDPYVGVDLDECVDPETGDVEEWAADIVRELNSYTEVSPSGRGLRVIARAQWPAELVVNNRWGSTRKGEMRVEMYGAMRYLTLTGRLVPGTVSDIRDRHVEFARLHRRLWPPPAPLPVKNGNGGGNGNGHTSPSVPSVGHMLVLTDERDGERAAMALWSGSTVGYPTRSEAHAALCAIFAFYTSDEAQIERLVSQSGVGQIGAWPKEPRYRRRTIEGALRLSTEHYKPQRANGNGNGHAHVVGTVPPAEGVLPQQPTLPRPPVTLVSGSELLSMELPEPRWAVPGLLPEGLSILGGKPKMGKSWLALGMCIAVASGGAVLGRISVTRGPVLYLALEDNRRRLKGRMQQILGLGDPDRATPALNELTLATEWPRLDIGGLAHLDGWVMENPGARLIIIDTWTKFKPRRRGNGNQYEEDYDATEALQAWANHHHVAVLVLAHLRKADAEDPFDTLNAPLGFSGGADSLYIRQRERGRHDATLYVSGRDVEEQELALKWDQEIASWSIIGDAQEYRQSELQAGILRILGEAEGALTPKELAEVLPGYSAGGIGTTLWRLARQKQIVRTARGQYLLPKVPVSSTEIMKE